MGYVSDVNAMPYLISSYSIGFGVIVLYGYFLLKERVNLLRIKQEIGKMREPEPVSPEDLKVH